MEHAIDSETAPGPSVLSGTAPGKSVFFVDDEPNVLHALKRILRPLRDEWSMAFAVGATEALQTLETAPFDVLITDMNMPGMNGAQLMQEVLHRYPRMIRIALSAHAERDVVVRAAGLAHQYLSKPCEPEHLKQKLAEAFRLRGLIAKDSLQSLVTQANALPSVPVLYAQVMAEINGSAPSARRIGDIISRDPAMTAKILQLINSAFFGLQVSVSDPAHAVQLLGLDTVRTLVLTVQIFSQFKRPGALAQVPLLWVHSLRTARAAATVARAIDLDQHAVNDAFIGGLLHDAGKLLLANACPEYDHVRRAAIAAGEDIEHAERRELGGSHADVGGYLFGLWALPFGIVEAVAWHHRPSECGSVRRSALTAVHAANAIDHDTHADQTPGSTVDHAYLQSLGLDDDYQGWTTQVLEGRSLDS